MDWSWLESEVWWNENLVPVIAVVVSVGTLIWSAIQNQKRNKFEQKQIESQNAFALDQANQRTAFEKELAHRKEKYDVVATKNHKTANYHLERRTHLSNVISNIDEAKRCFRECNNVKASLIAMEVNENFEAGNAFLSKAFIDKAEYIQIMQRTGVKHLGDAIGEARLYGHIPPYFDLPFNELSLILHSTFEEKLYFTFDKDLDSQELKNNNQHIILLISDLRKLMDYELHEHSNVGVENIPPPQITLPYLQKVAPLMPTILVSVDMVNFEHMDKYKHHRDSTTTDIKPK